MLFPLRLRFDMQQRQVFIFHDEMRIVRLCRILLAMTSKVHPGVLFHSFERTCSCDRIARNTGMGGS